MGPGPLPPGKGSGRPREGACQREVEGSLQGQGGGGWGEGPSRRGRDHGAQEGNYGNRLIDHQRFVGKGTIRPASDPGDLTSKQT